MRDLPALKTALPVAAGIVAARCLSPPVLPLFTVMLPLTAAACLLTARCSRRRTGDIAVTVLLVALGALRYAQQGVVPPNDIRRLAGSRVTLGCRLLDARQRRGGGWMLTAEADTAYSGRGPEKVRGRLIVYTASPAAAALVYGDDIVVRGRLAAPDGERNPGGFDYRAFLAARGIHSLLYADRHNGLSSRGRAGGNGINSFLIQPARNGMKHAFLACSGPESLEFLTALLLGDKSSLDPELKERFARAGVVHVLAVSGLHAGFVLLIISSICSLLRLGRHVGTISTLIGLYLYVQLTGCGAPVVRASLMAGFYLTGRLLERDTNPFNLIGAAALTLMLINPLQLFDPGFQLSFAAVISILYIYPRLREAPLIGRLCRVKRPFFISPLIQAVLVSLAAQLGTLPLTAGYFQRISLIALLVNLAAVPLAGLITALGFTTWFAWGIDSGMASVYGGLNRELIALLTKLVSAAGSLSFASVPVPAPGLPLSIVYLAALVLLLNLRRRRTVTAMLITIGLMLNLHIWPRALAASERTLRWIQFDVGQGDAALLRLPRGRTILIDGGDRTPARDYGEAVILPFLQREGIRRLDLVIATHPHNDHIGGLLSVVENVRVDLMAMSPSGLRTDLYRGLLGIAKEKGIPLMRVSGRDTLRWDGVMLVMAQQYRSGKGDDPIEDPNNMSIVTRVRFGRTNLMFMGDAETGAEFALLQHGFPLACDAIKAGHHGSRTSSSPPFLARAAPGLAVVSVGQGNRYRHPSAEVMERYTRMHADVYRTDEQGAAVIVSDGRTCEVKEWR